MASSADRRRKLLRDDSRKAAARSSNPSGTSSRRKTKAYSSEAKADNQPRVTDFIPLRPLHLWIFFLCGLIGGALINAMYMACVVLWKGPATDCLQLVGTGTLARASYGLVLFLAGLIALLIFHIRRYRLDDFQGRYRAWRWVALACLLGSADALTDLHQPLAIGLTTSLSTFRSVQPSILWLSAWFTAGVLLYSRTYREVWVSRSGSLLLFLSLSAYVASTLAFLGKWGIADPELKQILIYALTYLGHHCLCTGMLVYLRYVYLHSQNALPVKTSRKTRRKLADEESEIESDGDEESPETEGREPQEARPSHDARRQEIYDDDDQDDRLSKAERRKHRKEQRHSRAA